MMAKTHRLGGAAAGLGVISTKAYLPNVGMNYFFGYIPFMAGCIVGAYFCDIDSTESTISKKLWFIAWPYHLIQAIINFIIRNPKSKILKNIKRTANHRGLAHWISLNITGITILIIASYILKLKFGIDFSIAMNFSDINKTIYSMTLHTIFNFLYGFFIGCSSHILLDTLNPTGIPLLAPFSFHRFSFGNIVTSNTSKRELRFRFFLRIVVIFLLLFCFYSVLIDLSLIDNSMVVNTLDNLKSIQ